MADVRPLPGVRYRADLAAALGRLISPPYDTAPTGAPSARHPHNIGHLEDVLVPGTDDPHALAAERYRLWRHQGVLVPDPTPAFYFHEQAFSLDGQRPVRRGLLARVRLARWEERVILPHERTVPGPRAERLARLRAVRANLSPLYLLYRDPERELAPILSHLPDAPPDAAGTDANGDTHRLRVLADPTAIDAVVRFFVGRRLYVADGHHRYEAALAHRDERRAAGDDAPDAPHEFVLVLLADSADPGVRVLPTHRLVRGLPAFDPDRLRAALAPYFDLDRLPATAARDHHPRPTLVTEPGAVDICTLRFAGEPPDWRWRLRTKPGAPHDALLPPHHGAAWRRLDTAILGSALLERLLGISPDRLADHVAYTHDPGAATAAVDRGDAQLAALLAPPTLDAISAVADAGDPLPPKSTYFHPKAPAGLVIHDLDE